MNEAITKRGGVEVEVIFSVSGNVLVAELFGELDHHAASQVREDIDRAVENYAVSYLVFDFTKVRYMDSSGIGMVLGRYRKMQASDGKIAIVSCSAAIRNILNMAGIFSLMDYWDKKEEAITYFRRKDAS